MRKRVHGSELCEVIWKPWVTPWGQSLWKPRARVRTTCETDSGLWPTARANDSTGAKVPPGRMGGLALKQAASAGPTPTTRDHKDGSPCQNVPVNGLLGRMVWPTPTSLAPAKNGHNEAGNSAGLVAIRKLALYPTARANKWGPPDSHGNVSAWSGSSEQTEKPGALNPEFVCWLMGYPAAWVNCADSAMRSIRAQPRRSSRRQPKPSVQLS